MMNDKTAGEEQAENPEAEGNEPDQLEKLAEENAALRDRVLRAVAEMENLRKRTERERQDASKYSISNFARDMLGVGDNLTRALQLAKGETGDAPPDGMRHLIEGVEMTEREMLNIFERHGIKRLDPERGDRFDPNLHQAMYEVEDAGLPNRTVAEIVASGYIIGDRILRPAMVGVAKGGPRAPAPDKAEETPPNAPPPPQEPDPTSEGETIGINIDKSA